MRTFEVLADALEDCIRRETARSIYTPNEDEALDRLSETAGPILVEAMECYREHNANKTPGFEEPFQKWGTLLKAKAKDTPTIFENSIVEVAQGRGGTHPIGFFMCDLDLLRYLAKLEEGYESFDRQDSGPSAGEHEVILSNLTSENKKFLRLILDNNTGRDLTPKEIRCALGINDHKALRKRCVEPLTEEGLIKPLGGHGPGERNRQGYNLTRRGRDVAKAAHEEYVKQVNREDETAKASRGPMRASAR